MLDLTSLNKYIDEQRESLISKLGLDNKTASDFNLMTGVKSESALNLIDFSGDFQDYTECGFDASTSETSFTQRNIKVGHIKVEEEICSNKMMDYWMNYKVLAGAGRRTLPFEADILKVFLDDINTKCEKALWQGDTSTGTTDPNLNKFDGLITLMKADTAVIDASADASATAYEQVQAVYMAIPDRAINKAVIYVDMAKFRALCAELTAKNLYHYTAEVDNNFEIVLPGTSTKVRGREGLNGAKAMVAVIPERVFVGVDMAGDTEDIRIWYSEDHDTYRMRTSFNLGIQYPYGNETVLLEYA